MMMALVATALFSFTACDKSDDDSSDNGGNNDNGGGNGQLIDDGD